MKQYTREQFNLLKTDVATSNQVDDVSEKFTVTPAVEQRIVEQMGESSDFLQQVNVVGVDGQKGQKLGLGAGSPVASRTDTDSKDRETAYIGAINPDDYECVQTNFDTHLSYRVMDAWAVASGDFKALYRKAVMNRVALDRIMIGWNGTHAAKETDRNANPLLQDVNTGWLEKARKNAPARMMGYDSEGEATTDVIKVGKGGNYETLDALVFDITANLLDPWHTGSDDLVLILGRELWVSHGLALYNDNRPASERNALQTWFAKEAVAGLSTVMVPFFPSRGLVVTSYDNLSIYFQNDATRRAIIDNPKRDRVEEYLSSNDAYVIEDYGKFGGVRSGAIQLLNHKGEWE